MDFKKTKKWLWLVVVLFLLLTAINFNFVWHNASHFFKAKNYFYKTNSIGLDAEQKISLKPDTLFIPSLGIFAPVKYISENTEKVYQTALKEGVAHFPGTALPGQPGNVYIFGHSSDYIWSKGKYKTVFADLPDIKINEEIFISNSAGETFAYAVKRSFSSPSDNVSLLAQNKDEKILTLQTSWPLGTALKRWIVIAEFKSSLQ
jgi:LPXTG-site transpeptidase (sortase) family protein